MKPHWARPAYYLRSVTTLLRGIRNWPALLRLLWPGRRGGPVALDLRDGSSFMVNSLMDAWIVKETNLDRDYERVGVPLRDGWQVIDVGAGVGDFTVFAARRTPHGRVLAYEPAPDSVALLRRNLDRNLVTNASVCQAAVAGQRGELSLDMSGGVAVQYRTAGGQGQDLPRSTAEGDLPRSATEALAVPAITLADALAALPGAHCDFLKIDCEGAEYDILFNATAEVLARIDRICLEYHDGVTPHSHADLVRFLMDQGWSLRINPNPVHPYLGLLYAEHNS